MNKTLIAILAVAAAIAFVPGMANAQDHGAHAEGAASAASDRVGDPYPLDVCAVSGEKLGSMGEPIVIVHEGREVKFCCGGCPPRFNGDPAKYLAAVDEKIVAQQKDVYPLDVCAVRGSELGSMGEPIDMVVGNRLVRLCCKGCEKALKADPAKYIAKVNEAAMAAQRADYPFDKCVVSGHDLGDDPGEIVVAGRLVRYCCAGCDEQILADPAKYIAKIDSGEFGEAEGSDHK